MKSTACALSLALAIATLPSHADAATPKSKTSSASRIRPPQIVPEPLPVKRATPPTQITGCGSIWSDKANSPLYRALSDAGKPKSFLWTHPRDQAIAPDTKVEWRVQFEDKVKVEEGYNIDALSPQPVAEDGEIVAHRQTVTFRWYLCKVDDKGNVVLTNPETNETLRFKPAMDRTKKTVLSLTSEKDGLILKPAPPSYPAPSL